MLVRFVFRQRKWEMAGAESRPRSLEEWMDSNPLKITVIKYQRQIEHTTGHARCRDNFFRSTLVLTSGRRVTI